MRIAILTFGERVSPRFDYAPEALIVELNSGGEVERKRLKMGSPEPAARVAKLKEEEVEVVICGNIDVFSERMVSFGGLELIPWVTGNAEDAISTMITGRLHPGAILDAPGNRKRWRFAKGRRGSRRGQWSEELDNQKEDYKMPRGDGTGPSGKGPGTGRGLGPCGGGGGKGGKGTGGGRGMGQKSGSGKGRGGKGGSRRGPGETS